ncbi:TolC family protein [Myxococcaceae bacterium GXIMD 01537]
MPSPFSGHVHPFVVTAALLVSSMSAAEPLARAEALRQALRLNPELRAERERVGVVEADVVRARQLLPANPELDVSLGSDWLFKNSGERLLAVELQQPVEIAGQRGLRKAEARTRLEAARAQVQSLETRVARDVSAAWYGLWRAEQERTLAGEAHELARGLLKAAEARFQAGDLAELDRNVAAMDAARAERTVTTAETARVAARLELARLLGRSDAEAEGLTVVEEPLPTLTAESLDALKARAREHRADLSAAKRTEQAAAERVRLRSRERIPNPTLRLAYEREEQRLGALSDVDQHLFAGVALPLPFWNRGQAELKAATSERSAAVVEREAAERRIDTEVAAALTGAQQTQRAFEAIEAAVPLARRNLELVGRAFEAGQVELLLLLSARDRAQQAQRDYVEARAAHGRALDELAWATGQLPKGVTP